MVNSRDLLDLRPDVAENCRVFLRLCRAAGLNVLITQTLRDDEYQAYLYEQGRTRPGVIVTNSPKTSFHGKGLAFDFCKNDKGHEYDDAKFFEDCGRIAKQIGFTWGGDWRSFVDRPHVQWDDHGRYSSSMVRAGDLPPEMEEYVTQEQFDTMMDNYLARLRTKPVSSWANSDWEEAKKQGLTDGTAPQGLTTRQETIALIERALRYKKG